MISLTIISVTNYGLNMNGVFVIMRAMPLWRSSNKCIGKLPIGGRFEAPDSSSIVSTPDDSSISERRLSNCRIFPSPPHPQLPLGGSPSSRLIK